MVFIFYPFQLPGIILSWFREQRGRRIITQISRTWRGYRRRNDSSKFPLHSGNSLELHNTLPYIIPQDCPRDKKYIPPHLRAKLITWAHNSLATGHPETQCTWELLKGKYWWTNMCREINKYVLSCARCAQSKVPRHLTAGKLMPLPTPNIPWSHISVDFFTDLPVSEGKTTIMEIVDRFSKAISLTALSQLPTAFQTAEALFQNVFKNYGIPEDIVSDQGPQFISWVWKEFMEKLGVKVQ